MGQFLRRLGELIGPAQRLSVDDPLNRSFSSMTPSTPLAGNFEHSGEEYLNVLFQLPGGNAPRNGWR
jgi:hypothetical protein